MGTDDGVKLQREYYERTAQEYNALHTTQGGEHDLACALIHGLSLHYGISSILDVGSGTGRALLYLKEKLTGGQKIMGIEPVSALRQIAYASGITTDQLTDGDATQLRFEDSSFDLVCELGVLHHIPQPRKAVSEMLRVSKKAIFISDINRFGQGLWPARLIKLFLWNVKLWPLVNYIKTKGKGYSYSEGDGIAYSYSVFDDYDFIRSQCSEVMIFNLDGSGKRSILGAPHIGLLGIKK